MTDQSKSRLQLRETGHIESVEDYQFEPIKGYPMLQWHGKRPFTSTKYYPAQLKETYGPEVNGWRNKIFWGDNLQVMSYLLKEYRGKVKLIYLDPPFDSKADYKLSIEARGDRIRNDRSTFEEKQYTDIWTNDEYLQFIYERLILARELLSDDGSIYLHCDWHKSHYLRCILDEVFGYSLFRNEIIWHYSGWNKILNHNFERRHDVIYFYAKSSINAFNSYSIPYANLEEYLRTRKQKLYTDENGRQYTLDTREEGTRQTKIYIEDVLKRGKPIDDLWSLDKVNNSANEKTDYPTQKPESLLERIIKSSSNPGDLVFDCFMGSGTTQTVAMKLGRRFIGADINLGAVHITSKRLLQVSAELDSQQKQPLQTSLLNEEDEEVSKEPTTFYTGFEVHNVNHYDVFRNPVEAKELLAQALELNKLEAGHLFDGEKDGRLWKIMPVNRIATRQDLNDLIANFDYMAFDKRFAERPNQPVEKITLVCMGHEPDLAATLEKEIRPYKLDVEVVDILRDRQDIQFKRDSEARVVVKNGQLVIEAFYPMNLLSKLSLLQEQVDDWRELVESVMVDWNYDSAVLQPTVVDIPDKNDLVIGRYPIPDDAGTIRVKITDLLSESLEIEVAYG